MNKQELPLVTVIMPIRNEAKYIRQSLGAVLAQDYPADRMEVIVADGMSDDGTREILQSFKSQFPNLKSLDNSEKIVSTALNRAIEQAQGEIVVRVDGHCEIDKEYIKNCVRHIQSSNVDGVGGSIETIGLTSVARAIAAAMSSRFGVGDSGFRTLTGTTKLVDTIPFPAFTRRIIEKAGPYDEEQIRNQDDEYNYRLRKSGAKLLLAHDVRSRYYSRATLRSLMKQYFQYGYWKVRVMQKHPRQMRLRQFVPAAFVSTLIVSLVAGGFTAIGWIPFGGILGSYIVANLTASALATKKRWELFALLPFAFTTLHVSYGLGFMVGLVRFAGKWGVPGKVPPLRMRKQPEPAESAGLKQ